MKLFKRKNSTEEPKVEEPMESEEIKSVEKIKTAGTDIGEVLSLPVINNTPKSFMDFLAEIQKKMLDEESKMAEEDKKFDELHKNKKFFKVDVTAQKLLYSPKNPGKVAILEICSNPETKEEFLNIFWK
jgi:hypothetical protein